MKSTGLTLLIAFTLCLCEACAQGTHVFRTDVTIEKNLTVWGTVKGNVAGIDTVRLEFHAAIDSLGRLIPVVKNTVIEITQSQEWVVPAGINRIDVFVVGGGASGAKHDYGGGGGGGGYVQLKNNIEVNPLDTLFAIIGIGGSGTVTANTPQNAGGFSCLIYGTDTIVFAAGGDAGSDPELGGNGGSGGGAGAYPPDGTDVGGQGGAGGQNGMSVLIQHGGRGGSISTLCPFNGKYYAGGGGGGSFYDEEIIVLGGVGGGGYGSSGTSDAGDGESETGGGGGGVYSTSGTKSGNGGSGIIIIKY